MYHVIVQLIVADQIRFFQLCLRTENNLIIFNFSDLMAVSCSY